MVALGAQDGRSRVGASVDCGVRPYKGEERIEVRSEYVSTRVTTFEIYKI